MKKGMDSMKNRTIAVLLALAMCALSACSTAPAEDDSAETRIDLSNLTVDGKAISTDTDSAVYTANDIIYYEDGTDDSYGEGTEQEMHSAEDAAAHTVVHITQPGTYRLTGTLDAGQIFVDLGNEAKSDPEAVVTLMLDNVDITCTVAPAVFFYRVYECGGESTDGVVDTAAAGANVILADGSTNHVTGSHVARIYKAGTTDKLHKYDGAFYSKMSMNVSGEAQDTGTLYIVADNEGLDSEMHLTINGGNIDIQAQNDGINTNEDGVSATTINGGTLTICAGLGDEGDGIDSNGYLTINGGTICASGNGRTGDGGIDADGAITINGGSVTAFGSRNDTVDSASAQPYMELSFSELHAAGSVVEVRDASGNTILSTTADQAFQCLTLSDPGLTLDTTYSVYVDGVQQQYTGTGSNQPPQMPTEGEPPEDDHGDQKPPEDNAGQQKPPEGQPTGEMPPENGQPPEAQRQSGPAGSNPAAEGSTDFTLTAGAMSFTGVCDAAERGT